MGTGDKLKHSIRKYSTMAQLDMIRLLLSLSIISSFRVRCLVIKAAYMRSGRITRCIYIGPPLEVGAEMGKMWLLRKMTYGIMEAGIQWTKVIEDWILNKENFHRLKGTSQLYVKRGTNGLISGLFQC